MRLAVSMSYDGMVRLGMEEIRHIDMDVKATDVHLIGPVPLLESI